MCIIAIKKPGVSFPSEETISTCWEANPHGAGFMFAEAGMVHGHKGYMDKQDFLDAYHKVATPKNVDKAFVFHFRIATHGGKDAGMTHPFPITKDQQRLVAQHWQSPLGLAHNGILSNVREDVYLSDTAVYASEYLTKVKLSDSAFAEWFLASTGERCRLVLMYGSGEIAMAGDWTLDNGVYYSNTSFRARQYMWSDFDDDDEAWYKHWSGWQNRQGVCCTKQIDTKNVSIYVPKTKGPGKSLAMSKIIDHKVSGVIGKGTNSSTLAKMSESLPGFFSSTAEVPHHLKEETVKDNSGKPVYWYQLGLFGAPATVWGADDGVKYYQGKVQSEGLVYYVNTLSELWERDPSEPDDSKAWTFITAICDIDGKWFEGVGGQGVEE